MMLHDVGGTRGDDFDGLFQFKFIWLEMSLSFRK